MYPLSDVGRCVVALAAAALMLQPSLLVGADESHRRKPLNVFEGRVLDHQGRPAPSAKVLVALDGVGGIGYWGSEDTHVWGPDEKILWFFTKRNGRGSAEATTDADGRFRIKGLKSGKFSLLAVHPERGMAVVTAVDQPNAGNPLEVILQAPTFVEGSVKEFLGRKDGLFVTLACVSGFPWQQREEEGDQGGMRPRRIHVSPWASIKEDGQFRLGPLPVGGRWSVQVYRSVPKRRFWALLLQLPIDVDLGRTAEFRFYSDKGLQLAGQVVGPEGEALSDATVTLRRPRDEFEEVYGALTDKDGRYVIRGLPEGDYKLGALRHAIVSGPG